MLLSGTALLSNSPKPVVVILQSIWRRSWFAMQWISTRFSYMGCALRARSMAIHCLGMPIEFIGLEASCYAIHALGGGLSAV